ncbi:sensor histidine kinase [Leptospira wolffii]|uniref:histidine kinase n=1 Tax=Leptospira wolffii TaxID=409998 RepID=A0A2M9Z8V9_9LEPT|nr:HAMP domain-containing sensor histidine kinase [Leptospira wolffii]PJZ64858.1 sensor histidine kinase [Leptospira wolffii]
MNTLLTTVKARSKSFVFFIRKHIHILKELRSDPEFIRSSYLEVYLILRYLFPFLFVVYIPFAALDLLDYMKDPEHISLLIFNAVLLPGCLLFTIALNFPIHRNQFAYKKWAVISATVFLTFCGTSMNLLIFRFGTDLSLFSFTQLGIAILLRFPDHKKTFIYVCNYALFFACIFSLGLDTSYLIQNLSFMLIMTILFDQISFLTKVHSFHKEQSIRDLNHRLIMESIKKSEILKIAIHDLKSPVTGILSLVGLYTRDANPIPGDRYGTKILSDPPEVLDHIDRTARKILESIEEVLYLSNSDEMELSGKSEQALDPQILLKSVADNLDFLFSSKGIRIRNLLSEGSFLYHAHPQILYRVFDNILSNAAKFSPGESEILLSSSVRSQEEGSVLLIKIEDSGPGFRPEDEKNMFREFSVLSARPTASEPSSGLGLSLAKRLLDRMGIRIRLGNSSRTRGAEVLLEFPKSKAK